MKKYQIALCLMLFVALSFIVPAITFAQDSLVTLKQFEGAWSGKLKIQGMQLRLEMNVVFNEADSMTVTFDSPDQGILDLPTNKVKMDGDSLQASLKAIGGQFAGKMNKDGKSISGLWKQGGMSFPLVMERQGERSTLNRPQEPKPPFPYRVEEVTFPGGDTGCELSGTLTMPEVKGRYAVAILITGSGPQNRDEELLGHKPFLVLSDYLTRQGFAVLRYDDRGTGRSKGDFKTATTFDFAKDAEAALAFVKRHAEIDTTRMGLIGHSEGGLIAPIVASKRNDLAFVVLMAGPGLTGEQILLLQTALISKAEGVDEKSISANEKLSRDMYSTVKKTSDNVKASERLRKLFADFDRKNAKDTSYHPMSAAAINSQIETLTSPWFRCFLTLNPEVYISAVKCPLLAINGSFDLQVAPKENLQAIEKALIFGGNSTYLTEELPGLNHLFQTAKTGSPSEYGKIEETISPSALDLIGKWMKKTLTF